MKTETLVCDQCGSALDTDGTRYISIICTHSDGRLMITTYTGVKPCPRLDFCCLGCLTRFFQDRLAAPSPSPAEGSARSIVHLCPIPGQGLTQCCGRSPVELPSSDKMTNYPSLVTCPAFSTPKAQHAPE